MWEVQYLFNCVAITCFQIKKELVVGQSLEKKFNWDLSIVWRFLVVVNVIQSGSMQVRLFFFVKNV